MFRFTAVILISVIFVIRVIEADPVVCFDKEMCVRGKTFKGNLKEFEGFLGIPFAKKPVNELRLKVRFILNCTTERKQIFSCKFMHRE